MWRFVHFFLKVGNGSHNISQVPYLSASSQVYWPLFQEKRNVGTGSYFSLLWSCLSFVPFDLGMAGRAELQPAHSPVSGLGLEMRARGARPHRGPGPRGRTGSLSHVCVISPDPGILAPLPGIWGWLCLLWKEPPRTGKCNCLGYFSSLVAHCLTQGTPSPQLPRIHFCNFTPMLPNFFYSFMYTVANSALGPGTCCSFCSELSPTVTFCLANPAFLVWARHACLTRLHTQRGHLCGRG